jgi:hypothetical protein
MKFSSQAVSTLFFYNPNGRIIILIGIFQNKDKLNGLKGKCHFIPNCYSQEPWKPLVIDENQCIPVYQSCQDNLSYLIFTFCNQRKWVTYRAARPSRKHSWCDSTNGRSYPHTAATTASSRLPAAGATWRGRRRRGPASLQRGGEHAAERTEQGTTLAVLRRRGGLGGEGQAIDAGDEGRRGYVLYTVIIKWTSRQFFTLF